MAGKKDPPLQVLTLNSSSEWETSFETNAYKRGC
jgi:hypothetical protein